MDDARKLLDSSKSEIDKIESVEKKKCNGNPLRKSLKENSVNLKDVRLNVIFNLY